MLFSSIFIVFSLPRGGLEDVNFCQNDFGPDTDHIVDAVLALQGLKRPERMARLHGQWMKIDGKTMENPWKLLKFRANARIFEAPTAGLRYYNGISLLPSATTASFSMEKRPVMAHGLCAPRTKSS